MSIICSAFECPNTSTNFPGLTFFKFPADTERCHNWLENIGREDLKEISLEELSEHYFVCSNHFDKSYVEEAVNDVIYSEVEDCKPLILNGEIKDTSAIETDNNLLPINDVTTYVTGVGSDKLIYIEGIGHVRLKTEQYEEEENCFTSSSAVDIGDASNNVNYKLGLQEAADDEKVEEEDEEEEDEYLEDEDCENGELNDYSNETEDSQQHLHGDDLDDDGDDQDPDETKIYLCNQCGESFNNSINLIEHRIKIHGEGEDAVEANGVDREEGGADSGQFKCAECYQSFSMFEQLKAHVRNHVQTRHYTCDVCGSTFSHRSNLSRHKLQHCSIKKFQCDQCGKGFNQKSNLMSHQASVHQAIPGTNSEECNSIIEANYRSGAERIHRKPKVHKCGECGKSFVSVTGLKNHGALHSGLRPYVCMTCSKGFTLMSCLKTHIATIHSDKKHFCELCGKSYMSEHYLKIHLRIHTGTKDFGCDLCGKRFIDQPSLKLHIRTHTGEKPFVCRTCSRTFTQQSHLKTHMRIHTGEKPYQCKDCGKFFRQLSNVLEHARTHRKL